MKSVCGFCDDSVKNAVVLDKDFVPLRSVVYAPMRYHNLFLAGDAVHLMLRLARRE